MNASQDLSLFVEESKEHLRYLNEKALVLEKEPNNTDIISDLFRTVHSLKGNAGAVGCKKIQRLTHKMEDVLYEIYLGTIAVTPELINVLIYVIHTLEEYLDNIIASGDLNKVNTKIRRFPLKRVFDRCPGMIENLSKELNKKMEIIISGENIELDLTIINKIKDPLIHLIINAADHGLESNKERIQLGKAEVGRINLDAYEEGDNLVIKVKDDGRGIDEESLDSIFQPGFSTASEITEISGRGVGLDVVRTNISALNGSIEVKTKKGLGTIFIILIKKEVNC